MPLPALCNVARSSSDTHPIAHARATRRWSRTIRSFGEFRPRSPRLDANPILADFGAIQGVASIVTWSVFDGTHQRIRLSEVMQDGSYDLQVRLGHADPNVVDAPHPGHRLSQLIGKKQIGEINTHCLPKEMIAQVRGLTSCNLKYRPWRLVLNFNRAVIAHCLQIAFGHSLELGIIDRFDKATDAPKLARALSLSACPIHDTMPSSKLTSDFQPGSFWILEPSKT
jgi:hypothetical protein